MDVKKKMFLVIYLFILLFAPPLIKNVNTLLILSAFSFFTIIIKYGKKVKEIIKIDKIKKILMLLFIYFGWYALTIVINVIITGNFYLYNYIINFYSMVLVFPLSVICILHLYFYSEENNITIDDMLKYLIICGLVQSAISILSFLIPPLKTLLMKIMYYNTGDSLYINQYTIERRFFGFANNMLDSFGFGTGLLAALPLFYSIKNGKKWLITIPFLLILSLLNSRTGLIVFAIGFISWICYIMYTKKIRHYMKEMIYIVFGATILLIVIRNFYPATYNWIINDFLSFFTNKKGTADVLFGSDFWRLPNLINIVFGCGYNIAGFGNMKSILGFSSDVGYINEIWKTGIIGFLILGTLFLIILKTAFEQLRNDYKCLVIYFGIATLITNIKFYVFSYNPGIVIILLIFLFSFKKIHKQKYNEELVSIVVPIYNVEKYLHRCLNSILNQTYKNFEVIMVNDGSKDDSDSICKSFVAIDKRFKYIYQENQGLSAARNTGMNVSKGEYYVFVDSDDYLNIHFVEELYYALKSENADISVCEYKKVYDEQVNTNETMPAVINSYQGLSKFYNMYNEKSDITIIAWNKMYKKGIFEQLEYPVGKIHEDEFIIYDVLANAKKIAYTSCEYYYYYQRMDSITGTYKLKRLHVLEALKKRMETFQSQNLNRLYSLTLYNYYYQLLNQCILVKRNYPKEKKILKSLQKEIECFKKEFLLNIHIDLLKKIKVIIKLLIIKNCKE